MAINKERQKINFSDITELDEAFYKNAEVHMPAKQSVTDAYLKAMD